jgi:hypothetical protein
MAKLVEVSQKSPSQVTMLLLPATAVKEVAPVQVRFGFRVRLGACAYCFEDIPNASKIRGVHVYLIMVGIEVCMY